MKCIYFDNAATTFPKPPSVKTAVANAVSNLGGNPGRSGHVYSVEAAKAVYSVRQKSAAMFGAQPENTVFTQNCTHALNLALKGIANRGDRIVISSMEHNAAARPAYALSKQGARVFVAEVEDTDEKTVENFKELITPDTKCVVCTAASNVTGRIMPIDEIAHICRTSGVCLIVDGAQACGIIPMKIGNGINFICTAGHKGLYAATGTGLLISDGTYSLNTIMEGGTGATSAELEQTPFMPEKLECGTVNTVGIASLGAGIDYVNRMGTGSIYAHENALCEIFIDGIKGLHGVNIHRQGEKFVPIVSFSIDGIDSEAAAGCLSDMGFALSGGLHCAVLAHKTIGTLPRGTVRFSPSVFSSENDVKALVSAVKKILKHGL